MSIRKGIFGNTSGNEIPKTINLNNKSFYFREFVISKSVEAEDREFSETEIKEITRIAISIKKEFADCWKSKIDNDICGGIIRGVRMLLNILEEKKETIEENEFEDLKRWLEFGKKF